MNEKAAERISEISEYSKLCFNFIRKLTIENIELLKKIIAVFSEERKKFLKEVKTKSFELIDVWKGLQLHISGILDSNPHYISSAQNEDLICQKHQMSFLISALEKEISSCCILEDSRSSYMELESFKACFELIKSLLEGPLGVIRFVNIF